MAKKTKEEKGRFSILSDKKLTLKKLFSKKNISFALLFAAILTASVAFQPLVALNATFSDSLFQEPAALDGEIVVIGVDEETLATLGPWETWGRSGMAQMLNLLSENPENAPAVIGVDFMFYGETTPEKDDALAAAAKKAGNVIFASTAKMENRLETDESGKSNFNPYAMTYYEVPYDKLRAVSEFAHVNAMPDSDGVTRRSIQKIKMPEFWASELGIEYSESFALKILRKYNEFCGIEEVPNPPLDSYHMWEIPFSAEPGGYGDGYSFVEVLNGEIDVSNFAGKMVLIGPFAAGMQDAYKTPIAPTVMHGVEIHANAIDAMRDNIYRADMPWEIQLAGIFVMLVLMYFAFKAFHIAVAAIIFGLSAGLHIFVAKMLVSPPDFLWDALIFHVGESQVRLLMSPLYFPVAAGILFILVVAGNFILEQRRRNALSSVFKKYLDPRVVERMNEEGFDMSTLSSKRITASVMFVDIRGFTPFSEPLEPEEVVEMLGDYLTLTSGAVHKYEGFLDKFIGDATMAIFNAPVPQEDYAYKSVLAAWDISYYGALKIPAQIARYGRSVSPGIGLNMGSVIFGNIGPESRKDLTAIGDTVNTAARFESVAKPSQILMNETLYEALKDRIIVRYHGEMELKGKSVHPKTYALEQIVEYMGKYPPLASAAVPPGKGELPQDYDFESAPRLMPEGLSESARAAHLAEIDAQLQQLKIQYKTEKSTDLQQLKDFCKVP